LQGDVGPQTRALARKGDGMNSKHHAQRHGVSPAPEPDDFTSVRPVPPEDLIERLARRAEDHCQGWRHAREKGFRDEMRGHAQALRLAVVRIEGIVSAGRPAPSQRRALRIRTCLNSDGRLRAVLYFETPSPGRLKPVMMVR
jgi:hypothetical protein